MQGKILTISTRRAFATLALVLLGGLLLGVFVRAAFAPTDRLMTEQASGVASVMFDFGQGEIQTYAGVQLQDDESLFALTKRIAAEQDIPFAYKEYPDLGIFISKIGDGAVASNVFWQYWVNNVYAQVGADRYLVRPGDVIEWKLTAAKQ